MLDVWLVLQALGNRIVETFSVSPHLCDFERAFLDSIHAVLRCECDDSPVRV